MDRNNIADFSELTRSEVALRKESVDRNYEDVVQWGSKDESLSARRAWIEILASVAPLNSIASLSARRAWIEICIMGTT